MGNKRRVDWVGALFKSYGVVMIDEKTSQGEPDETRKALEYLKTDGV